MNQPNGEELDHKTYIMINHSNGARIECTQKYLFKWIAKGFEIEEIRGINLHPLHSEGEKHDKDK
ncbi:hypothetical protein [Paenibacillus polymyxa]|uniref:hypothetical protein n=1 Tax=Paenibacillus polymyxa TaxID=1406 RepID=UPI000CDB3A8B|nr:hypothetical protein [Paenibacillus polymyxa]POR29280.1 hypothetical protein CG775_06915 [Paenibacillus polymyxa]